MVDFLFVRKDFRCLVIQFFELLIQLHPLAGCRVGNPLFQVSNRRTVTSLLLVHVVRTNAGDGIRLIAVHVNQALEAILFAGIKEPVNGALLIHLAVVGIEFRQEVVSDDFLRGAFAAKGICDKL